MFKVGDKVRRISDPYDGQEIGDVLEVTGADSTGIALKGARRGGCHYDPTCYELVQSNNLTQNIMSNVLDFFRNLAATDEEKLLKEFNLENPIGTPTEEGLKLSAEISYKANRKEIIEIAKKMKEAEEKKK